MGAAVVLDRMPRVSAFYFFAHASWDLTQQRLLAMDSRCFID